MKIMNLSFGFMVLGLLLSIGHVAADEKLMLNDGTVLSIKSYDFDGEDYKVETQAMGLQVYNKQDVRCISYTCGGLLDETETEKAAVTTENSKETKQETVETKAVATEKEANKKAENSPVLKTDVDQSFFAIHGSNTVGAKLMPALLNGYAASKKFEINRQQGEIEEESTFSFVDTAKQYDDFTVALEAHGSSTSFKGLKSGEATIGMASRPIKDKEQAELKALGLGDLKAYGSEHVLALDGLTVIVSPNNQLSDISMENLAKVFSGEIKDWAELGGKAGAINIYARDDKSGTYDTFKSLVLKPAKVKLVGSAKRFESNQELSDSVAKDENGIGFTGLAYVRQSKPLALLGACGMRFEPSDFAVKTEEYPLARRLYLYTAGEPANVQAKGLVNFALSDQAQAIITEEGFINQGINLQQGDNGKRLSAAVKMPIEDQNKFKELSMQMDKSTRASVAFRFRSGSYELDNKAKTDIGRFARYLSKPENANKQFMLLGFADSRGTFVNNLSLSQKRADVVAAALEKEGVKPSLVKGYSELAPVMCNDGSGLDKNRRVEVWLLK